MTELSRSLIAAAREGLAPDPDVAARVRAKVAAAVAASAVAATGSHAAAAITPTAAPSVAATGASTAASSAAATVAAAGSSSLGIKLGAALILLGVASVGVVVVARDADRVPEVPPLSITSGAVEEVPAGERVAAPNDSRVLADEPRSRDKAVAPTVAAAAPEGPAAVVAPPNIELSELPEPTATPQPMATPEPASLAREVELIDLAMVSLRKNAPLAAIEAIRVFERETLGQGQMAEEAAAIEIEARCKLREDVTAALARFDRKWPESAQRERIQTACFAGR